MVKVVGLLLTEIAPPCCSIMLLQITNPNQVPVFFVVNIGSKIFYLNIHQGSYGLSIFITNLNIKLIFQPEKIVYAISQKNA